MPPDDDYAAQLAAEIAGTPLVDEAAAAKLDSDLPSDEPDKGSKDSTSQEPSPAQAQASQEDESGEPKSGDDEGKDGDKPTELTLEAILKDPKLGKEAQAWADRAAAAQVRAALDREREKLTESVKVTAQDEAFERYVQKLSRAELGELLAEDEEFARDYARYVERQQKPVLDADAVAAASQTYGLAAQIATYSKMLDESGLPPEKLKELDGNNFTDQGPDGIVTWGAAIWDALLEQRVQQKFDEAWEAEKQDRLAELDKDRPPMVNGRRTAGIPDLLTTNSEDLLERALSTPSK